MLTDKDAAEPTTGFIADALSVMVRCPVEILIA
jgi:hypothetical protein